MAGVGFVGLGRMGLSMARALAEAGNVVVAYDVSPQAKAMAKKVGTKPADSIAKVGECSEVVFLSLPDTDAVRSVILDTHGLLQSMASGGTIIDMSTISPSAARGIAAKAAHEHIDYLDAPVSGSIPWAESGRLTIMVGGKKEAYDERLPLLECIGEYIFYAGESGGGQRLKLCHQLIFYSTVTAICEAMALGDQLGIERRRMLEIVSKCAAPAHVLEIIGPDLAARDYENVLGDINLGVKDLHLVMEMSRDADFSSILGVAVGDLYRSAVEKGYGERSLLELSEKGLLDKLYDGQVVQD